MYTTEELKIIAEDAAKKRESGLEVMKGVVGDSFNKTALASAIATAETKSYIDRQVQAAQVYADLVPVNTDYTGGIGTALTLSFVSAVGKGRRYSGAGDDIALAEVLYGDQVLYVRQGALAYKYTIGEMNAAAADNIALPAHKPAAARLAYERHMQELCYTGEAGTTGKGLFNHNIPDVFVVDKSWDDGTKTGLEMVKDISNAIGSIYDDAVEAGNSGLLPNTVLIPSKAFRIMSTTMISANSTVSVLNYMRENNILTESGVEDVEFRPIAQLNKADMNGGGRIVAYLRDPSALEFIIINELTFLAPQPKRLEVEVPAYYDYAGIYIKEKNSIVYIDNILSSNVGGDLDFNGGGESAD